MALNKLLKREGSEMNQRAESVGMVSRSTGTSAPQPMDPVSHVTSAEALARLPAPEQPDWLDRLAPPQLAIPFLTAFGALLFLVNLGGYPFYTKGEPREAVTVFDIVHGGGVILPLRGGVELPSKPLLMHWVAALVSLAAGRVNEWTVRLPSAVFAILGIIACYYYVRKLFNERSGLIAALILGASCQYLQAGTGARVDMTLTFFLEVAFFEFIALAEGLRKPATPLYLASACAVLTKGPVGFALPLLVAAIWVAIWRGAEVLPRLRLLQGALIMGIIGGGWYLAAIREGGFAFVHKQLMAENLYRLFAHQGFNEGHAHPFYYMEGALVAGFMPWSPLVGLAILQRWQRPRRIDAHIGYLLVWLLTVLIFYNLPYSKRGVYLLACYPALSAIIALILSEAIKFPSLMVACWTRVFCRIAGVFFITTGASAIAGCAMLYVGPEELRWVLAQFEIATAELPLALCNATREHWLATALIPLATIAIGASMLLRPASVTSIVGGMAAGMVAMTLAVNLVIEPAIANTQSPKEFAARTSALAKSQTVEYFGSLDYAFVFYSGRDVKFVSVRDAPVLVVGLEEQWPLMPPAFRVNYRIVLRSNPTDLDGSGRMLLLRRTNARSW
jgi:4-amino-4-deoxy-L-arabinose transferase-like glycosyltransferase